MKLAIPFKLNNEKNDKLASEFNIKFTRNNSIQKLIVFLKKYKDYRINIEFEGKLDKGVLLAAVAVHNNVAARLKSIDAHNKADLQELKDQGVKYFFDFYEMAAYNRTALGNLIDLGVSDVYIMDDLCYNLKEVKERCLQENIQVRLILNRIPSTSLDKELNPKAPLFFPQLFVALDKWIDVAEFDCGKPYNWRQHEVLYRVWFEKHYWLGQLSEINSDVQFDFPVGSVIPQILAHKLNCNRRCEVQTKHRECSRCSLGLDLATTFRDKNFSVKIK